MLQTCVHFKQHAMALEIWREMAAHELEISSFAMVALVRSSSSVEVHSLSLTHTQSHTQTYKHTHTHAYVYVYVYVCLYVYVLMYIYVFVYMYVCTYVCTYVCIYVYIQRPN
jgi:cell division protein FtsW (lipid II flippase)